MAVRISVITPTFNRGDVLYRVYDSLKNQTYKDFEWIVVDDGSEDNTRNIVNGYIQDNLFPIKYYYQSNNGKHIALNEGMKLADGEMIAIADSDDSFTNDSFQIMIEAWDNLGPNKEFYRGITCGCYDPDTNEPIGHICDGDYVDYLGLDATYKYKVNFEMWGINRKDLMLKYPFPNIRRDKNGGLRFFPETVIWDNMGRDYKVRYISKYLRAYYRDQENATTSKKTRRSRENIYLWEHLVNDVLDYFRYSPARFIKAFIGITMDGLLVGEKYSQIVGKGSSIGRKVLIVLFSPVGIALYFRYRKR